MGTPKNSRPLRNYRKALVLPVMFAFTFAFLIVIPDTDVLLAQDISAEDVDSESGPILPSPNPLSPKLPSSESESSPRKKLSADDYFPRRDGAKNDGLADAPAEPGRIDDNLKAHWVMLDEFGDLNGRISTIQRGVKSALPARGLTVFLIRRGETIKEVPTSSAGEFSMRSIAPGVYTLVASGDQGFLAYGINVVPSLEDLSLSDTERDKLVAFVARQPVGEEIQIDAAAIPPTFTTLRQITRDYLPADVGISAGGGSELSSLDDIFDEDEYGSSFMIELNEDGSLVGRVQPVATYDGQPAELEKMNIFLLQDDSEIAREPIDEDGEFEVADVDPGVYAIVVAGDQGFAALSVQLIDSKDKEEDVDASSEMYASLRRTTTEAAQVLSIAFVADPLDLSTTLEKIDPERAEEPDADADPAAPPAPAGSVPGGNLAFEPFPEAPVPQNLPPLEIPQSGFDPSALVEPLVTGVSLAALTIAAIEIGDALDDDDPQVLPASATSTQPQ